MPVIRFNNWESQGRNPLTRGQRLVTSEIGAKAITSGVTRFQPGAKINLHYHDTEEQVTIIEGEAVAIIDGERVILHPYDTTHVPAGVRHHFMNESDKPMAILYIYPAAVPGRHEIDEATGKEIS
jgi:quercetin dioxygenase-like cupin family protein